MTRRWIASSVAAAVALTAAVWVATNDTNAQAADARNYVVLGDSYAAGVGAGNYRDTTCRQSADGSYPHLWVQARTRAAFGPRITNRSCSGATVQTVRDTQLGALDASTGWVTVTVGGNDVGFAATLQQCLLGTDATCHTAVQRSVGVMQSTLPGALDSLFATIRKKAPTAKVYVVGYPRLVAAASPSRSCGSLTDSRRAGLNSAADTLAEVTRQRTAGRPGFTFIDGRAIFAGREACTSSPWVHPLRTDAVVESFHPNRAGYQAYAARLHAVTG
ncbi:SGNH/GDSL hydrolase family protein [Micromonospora thermarum]|uniref:SGNH/GDSL hydrolase family protein n=1 Tax=Micromonospora thermarum TaxID=2720024 RepID=A0ABX0Z385_9ACTN|nr:SGNH/GDSL hydrolase family protein [Micromonospora thermarum]NJP31933.1 SGNH/GDSL hydrolase family protein [Micromonospora thermarum]